MSYFFLTIMTNGHNIVIEETYAGEKNERSCECPIGNEGFRRDKVPNTDLEKKVKNKRAALDFCPSVDYNGHIVLSRKERSESQ